MRGHELLKPPRLRCPCWQVVCRRRAPPSGYGGGRSGQLLSRGPAQAGQGRTETFEQQAPARHVVVEQCDVRVPRGQPEGAEFLVEASKALDTWGQRHLEDHWLAVERDRLGDIHGAAAIEGSTTGNRPVSL